MVEEKLIRDLQRLRELFLVFLGVAVALLVTAAAGDTPSFYTGIPLGWFTLWIVLTIGSIPLGILLLLGPGWRRLPLILE